RRGRSFVGRVSFSRGLRSCPTRRSSDLLNRPAVAAFNEAYFRAGAMKAGYPFLVHWNPYFFPLDGIGGWNRIYGRKGFLQYQCRSEEHTSELQSRENLVCRLLLEKGRAG